MDRIEARPMTPPPEALHKGVRAVDGKGEAAQHHHPQGQIVHDWPPSSFGGGGGALGRAGVPGADEGGGLAEGATGGAAGEMVFSGDCRKSAPGSRFSAGAPGVLRGGPSDSPAAPSIPGTDMADSAPSVRIAPAATWWPPSPPRPAGRAALESPPFGACWA